MKARVRSSRGLRSTSSGVPCSRMRPSCRNSTRVANPSEELKRMYDVQDALSHTQLRLNALINKAEAEHNARSFIAGSTIESDL